MASISPLTGKPFLVLGRAGMDLYADPPGTTIEAARRFTAALGGSAANIAVAIARQGGAASLLTCVANDAVGRFTLAELGRYGVGADHVSLADGEARNSLAVVETRNLNCQSVIYRNGAADFQLGEAQVRGVDFAQFGALVVVGTALAAEPSRAATLLALRLAGQAGLAAIFDVDYRRYSWPSAEEAARVCRQAAAASGIIVGNDEEFAMLAGGGDGLALAREIAGGAEIVVYKRGEKGAIAFARGEVLTTGVYQVEALKPTGAGDAFLGAFVMALAEGLQLRPCLLRGSAAAAIVVTRVGCAPAMPTRDELLRFMAANPSPA